ncbi:MAG: substrate-binding domain-containing protein [Spirochaetales bacterium]|nr:substrate-binding domain-containing protein [Spirochaetales bacterium]
MLANRKWVLGNSRPTIGILTSIFRNMGYPGQLFMGIIEAAEERDINLVLLPGHAINSPYRLDYQSNVIYSFVTGNDLDGLVLASGILGNFVDRERFEKFYRALPVIPTVSIGKEIEGLPSITVDNKSGMKAAVRHLIRDHGKRKIAFIRGSEGNPDAIERLSAYKEVLEESGIPLDPNLVLPGDFIYNTGYEAIRILIEERKAEFDAVIASNDDMAVGVMHRLAEYGLSVPGRVAVAGFDNNDEDDYTDPPLTSVRQPIYEMAKKALDLILEAFEGRKNEPLTVIPTELVVRSSCGCPAKTVSIINEFRETPIELRSTIPPGLAGRIIGQLPSRLESYETEKKNAVEIVQFILDIFGKHPVSGGAFVSLYNMVNGILDNDDYTVKGMLRWKKIFEIIEDHVAGFLEGSTDLVLAVKVVFQRIGIIVSGIQEKKSRLEQYRFQTMMWNLMLIIQEISSTLDFGKIMEILGRRLVLLDTTWSLISMYDTSVPHSRTDEWIKPEWLEIKMANDTQNPDIAAAVNTRYRSDRLIPPSLFPNRRFAIILKPIFFLENHYGLFFFEFGNNDWLMYETIWQHVCTVINSAVLFEARISAENELQFANDRLKEADRAKTAFFANVSHELRTPLTLIQGPLESILQKDGKSLPDHIHKYLGYIHANSLRLLKLINALLDFSKLEAGKVTLNRKATDIAKVLLYYHSMVKSAAETRGLRTEYKAGAAEVVAAIDRDLFEKAFFNLISNALKFTPAGGIITIGLDDGEESFTVSITDTGVGIPGDKLATIFERFAQLDASPSRKYEGTGIGLAFTKEIVELHGGKIGVESKPGEGSVFSITLPKGIAVDGSSDEKIEEIQELKAYLVSDLSRRDTIPGTGGAGPADRRTILVVDDNPDMRGFMKSLLDSKYSVILAENGVKGLEKVRREIPALIISDVMMPEMDGYEFCRRIRTDEKLRHIPFILVTARADMAMRIEGLEQGADDYLVKPFNAEELDARVRNLIASRELEKQLSEQRNQLENALDELKATQQQLILNEKLASIGQLLAGISHELNTPFSVVKASNENLITCVDGIIGNLPKIVESLEPGKLQLFFEMVERASGNSRSLSSREERALRDKYEAELKAAGIQDTLFTADMLLSMGYCGSIAPFLELLGGKQGRLVVETGVCIAGLKRHSANIGMGIKKSNKIVFALKNFTHIDKEAQKKNADLTQGIESVLVLYQNQLKHGVEVIKRFDPVPSIACYPDELNQVWVNLISNSLHAMNYRGTLEIGIRDHRSEVLVSITDSGCGIPETIRNRVFEPFFTTKEAGFGSGLGLDICRKIVKKHNGSIDFESVPGRTVFTVRLPK